MFVILRPPESKRMAAEREVSRVEQHFRARKMAVGEEKRGKFDRKVAKSVEEWSEKAASLHARLKEMNDLLEGAEETVDFPFGAGNSSALDVRQAAAKARTLKAQFSRLVFSTPDLFVSVMMPGAQREGQDNLAEGAVNWTATHDTNLIDTLKETPIPAFRDSVALVYGEWRRKIERGVDFAVYETVEDFMADYPDHDAAGVTSDKYDEMIEDLAAPEGELHVEYETDFVSKNGPAYTNFPLAKLIWHPLYSKSLRDADVYGHYFTQPGSEFRDLVKRGFYDREPAAESRRRGGESDWDTWDESRDRIEGLDGSDDSGESYRIAKLVVAHDFGTTGRQARYLVHWDMDGKRSLRIERYGMWRNVPCIVPYRLVGRDDRFLGVSLLNDGKDLVREVNALHRHRSNTRKLSDTVTLVLPKSLKEDVDLGAEYAEFRPGMTLWVPDSLASDKYPKQLQIHNLSRTNDSLDEESLVVRYLDGLFGVTEGQSGKETPTDPSAPAAKTRMLLQRADIRTEDLVEEWKRSIPDQIDLHVALYYQNAPAKLKFMQRQEGKPGESEIATAVLAEPRRRFVLKAVKPSISPEFEMNRLMALVSVAFQLKFPAMMKPDIIIQAWNDYVIASRIEMPERFQIKMGEGGSMTMGGQPMDMAGAAQAIRAMAASEQAGRKEPAA